MKKHILFTERLWLREWKDTDIGPFAKLNSDPDVMRYFPKMLTYDETAAMVEQIQMRFERDGFSWFVVEDKASGEFVGFAGLSIPSFSSFFTPCVEIGWRFHTAFWKKGLATEAANACLKYGFDTLGLGRIVSFTTSANTPSENVMKRIGMRFVDYFHHPKFESNHPLAKHVLYEMVNGEW